MRPARFRLAFLGASLGAALVLALVAPASADTGNPWSEVASGDFSLPAGELCPFAFSGTVLSDKERIRTLETYPDGSPKVQKVVGELVVRYTNEETAASVDRNLTGNGIFGWRRDGSMAWLELQGGHMGVGVREGSTDGPAFLVLSGAGHTVTFHSDGSRTIEYGSGPVEDICETLAG